MFTFIWNIDKTAIIKVDDISSVKIRRIADDSYWLEAKMIDREIYVLEEANNIRDAKQLLANWQDRLSNYHFKKKW